MVDLILKDGKLYIQSENDVRMVLRGDIQNIITEKGQWKLFDDGELVKVPEPSNNGNP